MIRRSVTPLVREYLAQFPAVGLIGPRQCGKTTLAHAMGDLYFDIERPEDRARLDVMWDDIIAGDKLAVFDEAQTWPELFSRLRGAIDSRRRTKGRFMLLGSISPTLMKQVGQSLAGRLGLVELTPFHAAETAPATHEHLWRTGGFPEGGFLGAADYPRWQSNYLKILSRRDFPMWGLPAKPVVTERLFRLLAAAHGSNQNATGLGQHFGLSYHTIQSYLDYLEGAFLIRRLPPYFANISKRLIKSPKIYWRDSGVLHHLLGLGAKDDLIAQPWVGASWEGWVIEQILADRSSRGIDTAAHYFRTSDGLECDLVLESGGKRELIEIRLTTAPSTEDLAKLRKVQSLIGADRIVLLTRVKQSHIGDKAWSCNLRDYLAAQN